MVEGGRLEIVLAVLSRYVGSNPTFSAIFEQTPSGRTVFLYAEDERRSSAQFSFVKITVARKSAAA